MATPEQPPDIADEQQVSLKIAMSGRDYKSLRSAMGMRIMAGSAHGLPDDFVRLIIASVEKGETERLFAVEQKTGAGRTWKRT